MGNRGGVEKADTYSAVSAANALIRNAMGISPSTDYRLVGLIDDTRDFRAIFRNRSILVAIGVKVLPISWLRCVYRISIKGISRHSFDLIVGQWR